MGYIIQISILPSIFTGKSLNVASFGSGKFSFKPVFVLLLYYYLTFNSNLKTFTNGLM